MLKILVFVLLAPIAILTLAVAGAAAVVGVPLLWEALVARYTAPPKRTN